ncbi:HPT domain superfamily [Sesbania bispinosa]|nr:HPT domain superfamily [Sesbania bispinosa]
MGVVNEHFYGMVSQRQTERNQIIENVEAYFADVDMSLSELSRHVDKSEVDFSVLASLARGIEDKSARIGAEHMRLACSDIIQACDEKNKKRKFEFTDVIKQNLEEPNKCLIHKGFFDSLPHETWNPGATCHATMINESPFQHFAESTLHHQSQHPTNGSDRRTIHHKRCQM